MDEPELSAYIDAVLTGDDDAARVLVRHLYPVVLRMVRAHLPRRASEEDLCQMTFVKVFSNLDRYSRQVPLHHWVSRIAINTCLSQLKAESSRPELRWADLSEAQAITIENLEASTGELDASQSVSSRDLVELMMSELNPADRTVITLMDLEGRSVQDVKELTGWNASVIKVRAFRARRKLKSIYTRLTGETGR